MSVAESSGHLEDAKQAVFLVVLFPSCFSSVVLLRWCSWPQLASTVLAMGWILPLCQTPDWFCGLENVTADTVVGEKGWNFNLGWTTGFSAASAGWCVCFSVADGWCTAEWHRNPRNPLQNLTVSRLTRCQKAKRKRKGSEAAVSTQRLFLRTPIDTTFHRPK